MAPETKPDAVKTMKEIPEEEDEAERVLRAGKVLANPPPGEEVVITGMGGCFPESDNIHEYHSNLLNKKDMITSDNRRWECTHPEIPQRTGKIGLVSKFDAGFFGCCHRQAESMDPMGRRLLEHAVEAIMDAGYNLEQLRGTNTGVFVGTCYSESEKVWFYDKLESPSFAIKGCERSMQAQCVSNFLGLEGPSHTIDTACSSSMYAFEHAYKAIRTGRCEAALVGGANVCFHPIVSLQFSRLGVLSKEGVCRSFDADANGYVRSETTAVVLLQKSKDAKRIYAQVIHAKTNCDGFKEHGITFPSAPMQKQLLEELYQECAVDPTSLDYLEAHATGTKVGDPEEMQAMDAIFCTNREKPLYVGSIKSNLGHTEPASALCSIVKVLLGMENDYLLPNINYISPREGVEALTKGRMVVVTETTRWPKNGSGLVGVNSFGFGGANGHVLLKKWTKTKRNNEEDLPRLICVSARTQSAIECILEDVQKRALDVEFVKLIHESFGNHMPGHPWRGYMVFTKQRGTRSFVRADVNKRPLGLVFNEPNEKWPLRFGKELATIPLFSGTIWRAHNFLFPHGIDLIDIIKKGQVSDLIDTTMANLAIQITIVDIIKTIELPVDYIVGNSMGELVAAYADGALTLKQTLTACYLITKYREENHEVEMDQEKRSKLLNCLKEVLPEPNEPSTKWLPTTRTKEKYASAEYFIDCLFQPLKLQHAMPSSTTVLCVGTALKETTSFHIINVLATEENGVNSILETLGQIYLLGYTMKLAKLYPVVELPVSAGTPLISPLIKWDHSADWYTAIYGLQEKFISGDFKISFTIKDADWGFLTGHMIDGRVLVPATAYIFMVWKSFSILMGTLMTDMRVVFENVKFLRATNVPKIGLLKFNVAIHKVTGDFEVVEMEQVIVTGRILICDDEINLPMVSDDDDSVPSYLSKDIYKELKLRGYNYLGEFRAINKCNLSATKASIKWSENWITFIDNMFQMKILEEDTRSLCVPTGIERLAINASAHVRYVQNIGSDPNLSVYAYKANNIIKCGGIEVRGLSATSIPRKKVLGVPVLEAYKFVPFEGELSIEESIRVQIQILLENIVDIKLRIVEVFDEVIEDGFVPLSETVFDVLNDLPLIQPLIVVFSSKKLEVSKVLVEDKKLSAESKSCNLVIVWRFFSVKEIKADVLNALKPNGIILSREDKTFNSTEVQDKEFDILSTYDTGKEKLVLLRRHVEIEFPNVIDLSDDTKLDWLPKLQNLLKKDEDILVYAQNSPTNGILGFINCLRRESNAENIKCVFLFQNEFNLNDEFCLKQIRKGLAMNVFKDGEWGTYRHVKLAKDVFVAKEHVFNNVAVRGDLSSLRWLEGPLKSTSILPLESELVKIYYASLNFRDVMTATGRISNDIITRNRIEQYNMQGLEFAGRDQMGRRVMGMATGGALASMIQADSNLLLEIPDGLSMEEAVSIPVVYGTVLHGFILIANIQRGQSVLIHAGTGGIGQAAINVALHYGCNIFTTVGTQEKRDFIRKEFPQILESQIGNSRDTSFEDMIFEGTNGRGVDIVLNSLSEEKLKVSIRCLAPGGKFLEIGKFDLSNNNFVSLDDFRQGRSFHGVMVDAFLSGTPTMKRRLGCLIMTGVKEGYVKPLNRTIFNTDQVEEAFRYMAGGKHTGKVIIKIRNEESRGDIQPKTQIFNGLPRFYGSPDKCYIICGGLGGFGLELADWLVTRGVTKLVLVSRSGIKNGYQASRLRIWNSYGVVTKISTADTTTMEGCTTLMKEANEIGSVEGIFNLAAVLKDGIIENQNVDSFMTSLLPKSVATRNFDVVSREMCPNLKYFVVFSSVSCGRGNVGQTNYGMANSIMERICEQRKKAGFPALAIQWGAIGEVGLVADMQELQIDMEIGGTLQQRVGSCLEVMDIFLSQKETIVASMVVAEKRSTAENADDVIDSVKTILGIGNLKTVSLNSTLSELGMDSMMAVEIKQTLEREYEFTLSAQEIRNLTFARLQEISQKITVTESEKSKQKQQDNIYSVRYLFSYMVDEENSTIPMIKMETLANQTETAPKVFLLPGIEGMAKVMESLAVNLTSEAVCLQYTYKNQPESTIEELANSLLPLVQENLPESTPFTLVAHSYGCAIVLELASLLEKQGRTGRVILLDGSPALIQDLIKLHLPETISEPLLQTCVLCILMQLFLPLEIVMKYKAELYNNCKTFEERIEIALTKLPTDISITDGFKRKVSWVAYMRFKAALNYRPSFPKLKSSVALFKPSEATIAGYDDNYQLQELCLNPVEIATFAGNHLTILKNPVLADAINKIVDSKLICLKHVSEIMTAKEIYVERVEKVEM